MKTQVTYVPTKRFRRLVLQAALCSAHRGPRRFAARVRRPRSLPAILCALSIGASAIAGATSESGISPQETLDEAWWTGPIMAPNASTLPQGHWLIEPYFYDVMTYGRYDHDGSLQSTSAAHEFGSQSYIEYGLVDRLTLGLIPRFGFHESSAGQGSAGGEIGDTTLQGAFGLTQFRPGSWVPATSLVIGETFPTGKYDRLNGQTDGALGSGAYSTTVSFYSQTYLWMPNGRILRARFDLSYQVYRWAQVHDVSVYGTSDGFGGRARPGPSTVATLSFEYSVTQKWVLANDFDWEHDGNTRVAGGYPLTTTGGLGPADGVEDSGADDILYLAPAVEYNWSGRMGVIAGARIAVMGRNVGATVTPVAAINMVF